MLQRFSVLAGLLLLASAVAAVNYAQDAEDSINPAIEDVSVEETSEMMGGPCPLPTSLLPAVHAVGASLHAGSIGVTPASTKAIKERDAARTHYKHALLRYKHARHSFKEATLAVNAARRACATKTANSSKELSLLRILSAKVNELVKSSAPSMASEMTLLQAVIAETSEEGLRSHLKTAVTGQTNPKKLLPVIQGLIDKVLSTHHKCSTALQAHIAARAKVRELLLLARKTLHHAAANERSASRTLTAVRTASMRNSCSAAFGPARKHLHHLKEAILHFGDNAPSAAKCPPCHCNKNGNTEEEDVQEADVEEEESEEPTEEEMDEEGYTGGDDE